MGSVVGTVAAKVCIFFETAKLLRINLCKTIVFERRLHIITVSFARLTINFVVSLLLNFSGSCFSSFRLHSFSNFLPFLLSIGTWFLFLFYVAVSFEFTSHLNSKLEYIYWTKKASNNSIIEKNFKRSEFLRFYLYFCLVI